MRPVFATCSSVIVTRPTGVLAEASMTFGAGNDPAVTKPSICPFFSASAALPSSASAIVTLSFSPNRSRYFSPSVAPKEPLPSRMVLPERSDSECAPLSPRMTKCIVSDGIGNSDRISEKRGLDRSLKGPLPAAAAETSEGGAVKT